MLVLVFYFIQLYFLLLNFLKGQRSVATFLACTRMKVIWYINILSVSK